MLALALACNIFIAIVLDAGCAGAIVWIHRQREQEMSKATDRADGAAKVHEIILAIIVGLVFWVGLIGAAMVGQDLQEQRLERDRAAAVEQMGMHR